PAPPSWATPRRPAASSTSPPRPATTPSPPPSARATSPPRWPRPWPSSSRPATRSSWTEGEGEGEHARHGPTRPGCYDRRGALAPYAAPHHARPRARRRPPVLPLVERRQRQGAPPPPPVQRAGRARLLD